MSTINENEIRIDLKPVGVRYRCELCGEGTQNAIVSNGQPVTEMEAGMSSPLFVHKCTKCGGEMKLPKIYPFIDWVEKE